MINVRHDHEGGGFTRSGMWECGSRYARMDREGCARSTLDRNRLDARVFHMPSTLRFLRKSCLRVTSTLTSIFLRKRAFVFWPFYRKELFQNFPVQSWLDCPLQKPQRTGRNKITVFGPSLTKPDLQATKYGCLNGFPKTKAICVSMMVLLRNLTVH